MVQEPNIRQPPVPATAAPVAATGFNTHGTMIFDGDKWVAHEMVENNANGITKVRSTSEFLPDGTMQSAAEFLQNGQWAHGHSVRYVESPGSPVIFK